MTVVRKLTNRIEFSVNYSALNHANQAMDDVKRASSQLGRNFNETGRQADKLGNQFRGSSTSIKDLNRQIALSKSALHASTAGLQEMGNKSEYLRQRASGLSDVIAIQSKKVSALKGEYNKLQSQTVVSVDKMSKIKTELNEQSAELKTLRGELYQTSKSFSKLTADSNNTFKKIGNKYKTIGGNIRDAGEGLTDTFGGAAIAVGGALGYAAKKAMDFQQEMANTKSVMNPGYVKKYSGALEHLAIVQGAKTKYSATQAAQAEGELLKAGLSVSQVMHGGLSGALNLATAGQLDLKDAAEIASTALNAFKRDNISVAKAADILAGAANASASDVGELNYGLQQVSAVASGVGWSFKDTTVALAQMAQAGIKGSDAGTSLKTMLQNLQPQTKNQAAEFKALGIITKEGNNKFVDAKGNFKSLSQVADILHKSLSGMSAAQRQAALTTMFGTDAVRAGNVMYEAGARGINKMAASMDKIKASDVAKKKMDTFNGAVEQLRGSAETAGISIGQHLLPIADKLVDKLQGLVDWFNKLTPHAQKFITYATVGTGVVVGLAAGFGLLLRGVGSIVKGYAGLIGVIGKMTGRASASAATLAAQRAEMLKNTAAAEDLAAAENSAMVGVSGKASKGATAAAETAEVAGTAAGASKTVSKGGKILGAVGKAGKFAGGSIAALDVISSLTGLIGMTKKTAGAHIGNAAGSLGGTAAGAAIGSAIAPGIGTAVGAALGSWLGSKGGEVLGNAVQKSSEQAAKHPSKNITAGDVAAMNYGVPYQASISVKAKSDPAKKLSKSVKGLVKDYNSASRSIDNRLKTIAVTGGTYSDKMRRSVNRAYDSIVKSARSAARSQERATKGHLDLLVKEGLMSRSTANQVVKSEQRKHDTGIRLTSNMVNQLKKLNNSYYKKMRSSSESEERELSAVRRKYGTRNVKLTKSQEAAIQRLYKKYSDSHGHISARGLQKVISLKGKFENNNAHLSSKGEEKVKQIEQKYANKRRGISAKYSKARIRLEKALKSDVAGVLSKSSAQQKIILGKLRDSSGKLSQQQTSKILKQARKSRDGAVSAANNKYKKVMAAADQEYYVTGSISKKQYEKIVKKARDQRDDSISAANKQWKETVSAAKKQSKGIGEQMDWQTGKIHYGWWNKILPAIGSAFNWLTKLFTGKSGSAKVPSNLKGSSQPNAQAYNPHIKKYSEGTISGGHPGGNAILGDGGKPELWITPQGHAGLSPAIPTMYQNMPAGTQVLNGDDTERALGAKAYAKGTSGFWSSIGDFLGKGFNWLKKGASSAAGWVMDKFHLGSVPDTGILTNMTKKYAWPALKKMIGGAISNLAHSMDFFSAGASGNAKSWTSIIERVASSSGVKLTGASLNAIIRRIQKESGGNQTVRQKIVDINSRAGHPAQGLLQYIPSTFAAWARPGHTNILSGVDQLFAMFNDSNWLHDISAPGGWGPTGHRRYANGTPGSGAWAAKVFGSRKKEKKEDPQGNIAAIHNNRAVTINAPISVTINVPAGSGLSASKIARLARAEIEKAMQNLLSQYAPGVEV